MNIADERRIKRGKIILLAFENKRICDLGKIEELVERLASFGYYCDKISRVAFDSSEEITRAVEDGVDNYENIIIYCPSSMGQTFRDFISRLLGADFDNLGVLSKDSVTVFLLWSDGGGKLAAEDVKAVLDKKYSLCYDRTVIRTVGAPVSALDGALKAARACFVDGGAHINVTDSFSDCRIEIVYSSQTPKMALDGAVREIVKRLGEYIYALEDVTLAEQLYRLLKLRRMKIAVAESFTGGGVGKRLVEVSGISEVYYEGLNTYSNQSKTNRLGVKELTLNQQGAVSAETAYQMAEGLLRSEGCEVAISTTGIAGPKSDNTSKPVGLGYIGVGVDGDISVYKFNFTGDRERITNTAVNQALFLAYKRLK
ncbi:MAG: nicotinamide-nucleotide amidohydrolase family protein, partial [Clostridia bacterium]|nr:nicotinamide-nucleotide amidohydrolase family protein [Clostridia bacterium]